MDSMEPWSAAWSVPWTAWSPMRTAWGLDHMHSSSMNNGHECAVPDMHSSPVRRAAVRLP